MDHIGCHAEREGSRLRRPAGCFKKASIGLLYDRLGRIAADRRAYRTEVAAADLDALIAIAQQYEVRPALALNAGNIRRVDQRGTVYAQQLFRKTFFQLHQRVLNEVRAVSVMNPHILVLGKKD